jgi:Fur family ferric uptake transcriptional regulator
VDRRGSRRIEARARGLPRVAGHHSMRRRTCQLDAIRRVFDGVDRPISPQECLALARQDVPTLGIATVYRNVRRLVGDGWLRVVELPGGSDRYERAGKRHHHHFHCRGCDAVFEVEACPGDLESLSPRGFRLEAHELILYGRCDRCSA